MQNAFHSGIELDVNGVRRGLCRNLAQGGAFRGNHGAFGFMVLRGKQPEEPVIDVKLAALFADAAFAQDEDLLTTTKRIDHNGPIFEGDVGAHPHDAQYVTYLPEAVHPQNRSA